MALIKNALIRYQVLDKCFRNPGRNFFLNDLLDACNDALYEHDQDNSGIARRQLYDDISFMESEAGWSIPLERHHFGKKVFYRYSDLSFSISNQPLNDTEAQHIRSALSIISRFAGTPQFQWVNEIIPFLEDKFGLIQKGDEVISLHSNIDLKGIHLLSPLFNAIMNKRVLKIRYQDFKSPEPYELSFHPYFLKQFNDRWFVLGLNEENEIPHWNLAIDRIEEIVETDLLHKPSDIEWESHFYDIIGVTRPEGGEIQQVELNFTHAITPYVITKPLHPSQKHKKTEAGLEVRIKVIPNYELQKLILSFGEEVVVISPLELREQISTRLKQAISKYG